MRESALPARSVACVAVALVQSLLWSWNHALSSVATLWMLAATVVAAALLALLAGPLVRRLCPDRPVLAIAVAAFFLFGLLPAFASHPFIATAKPVPKLGLVATAAFAMLVLAAIVARFGPIATTCAAAIGAAWAFSIAPAPRGILPPPRIVAVPIERPSVRRVAVIGIDSADWREIDPLLAAGELPNLRALIERGAAGVLRSAEPTYSPVVWTSIFTGKTPAKHGITGWYSAYSTNRRASPLWQLIRSAPAPSVVVNVPGSWPPRDLEGVLVSGFPMPTVLRPPPLQQQQVLGRVFATVDRPGALVPTVVVPTDGTSAEGDVVIGEVLLPPRTRLRNYAIDLLDRKRLLPANLERVRVRFDVGPGPERRVEVAGQTATLAPGAWSPWLRHETFGYPVRFRLRALDAGAFYCTPFFQDPLQPMHDFTNDPESIASTLGDAMYVVEGAGWRIAQDPDLRDTLVEHLRDVETQHLQLSLALAQRMPDWQLFVHVFTLVDRTSHAFHRFHAPEMYPPVDPEELRKNRDRLDDAYRWVDLRLGEMLPELGEETTILVISDHGSAPPQKGEWGWHRTDGVWIAAGPGVAPSAERKEISLLDVTPTLLAAFGMPAATDMDGIARMELLAGAGQHGEIASYDLDAIDETRVDVIDSSTENQLRSLGYVE